MALLNFTAAARAAGVNRSTIARALKTGRLSTTTNDAGERCIDTAELMRVFGPLRSDAQANAQAMPMHAIGDATLIEVLREQLRQSQERETRLLAMLESEQQARRELEQKLLPAPPKPAPASNVRLWILLVLLALALAGLVVSLIRPELIGRLIGS